MLLLRNAVLCALPLSPAVAIAGQTIFNSPIVTVRAFSSGMNLGMMNGEKSFSTDASDNNAEDHKHRLTYSVTGTSIGSVMNTKTKQGHEMATDLPRKFGGTDAAPTPVEMLLASLIGCEQATAVFVGRSMKPRILIDRIHFDLQVNRDARGALQFPIEKTPDIAARPQRCFGTATVFLSKEGQTIPTDQLALLKDQTEARCPIANMMEASGCVMDISWIDGSTIDK